MDTLRKLFHFIDYPEKESGFKRTNAIKVINQIQMMTLCVSMEDLQRKDISLWLRYQETTKILADHLISRIQDKELFDKLKPEEYFSRIGQSFFLFLFPPISPSPLIIHRLNKCTNRSAFYFPQIDPTRMQQR